MKIKRHNRKTGEISVEYPNDAYCSPLIKSKEERKISEGQSSKSKVCGSELAKSNAKESAS